MIYLIWLITVCTYDTCDLYDRCGLCALYNMIYTICTVCIHMNTSICMFPSLVRKSGVENFSPRSQGTYTHIFYTVTQGLSWSVPPPNQDKWSVLHSSSLVRKSGGECFLPGPKNDGPTHPVGGTVTERLEETKNLCLCLCFFPRFPRLSTRSLI